MSESVGLYPAILNGLYSASSQVHSPLNIRLSRRVSGAGPDNSQLASNGAGDVSIMWVVGEKNNNKWASFTRRGQRKCRPTGETTRFVNFCRSGPTPELSDRFTGQPETRSCTTRSRSASMNAGYSEQRRRWTTNSKPWRDSTTSSLSRVGTSGRHGAISVCVRPSGARVARGTLWLWSGAWRPTPPRGARRRPTATPRRSLECMRLTCRSTTQVSAEVLRCSSRCVQTRCYK